MTRHYYAIYHPYGISMSSAGDTLYRYRSASERDASVDDHNLADAGAHGRLCMRAVTRSEARYFFPEAFRDAEWFGWGSDFDAPQWRSMDDGDEWTGWATGGVYAHI